MKSVIENNVRLIATKAILWMMVGAASAIAVVRYLRGLGATTALTDANPWGLWIGFDVLSGVALAAGGFVIAATVYVVRLERFHALVRPAVLTAFLGYLAVVLGLLVDLGRPWNIWRMTIFWNPHSPLFEVGWCVMLYLTVLALEFAPVVFEGLRLPRLLGMMRRITVPLVIAGIALSTLHQSSLGTLFLLAEDRLHPLWYSPLLPVLFFVSAVGLGLLTVSAESMLTSWLYRRAPEWNLLRPLTRASAVVLAIYLALRLGDLAWRGQVHHLAALSWPTVLLAVELSASVVLPMLLFTLPRIRTSGVALGIGTASGIFGFILHRANVGGIAHLSVIKEAYVPALTEIVVSLGVVSLMTLIFLFFVDHFPVWEEAPPLPHHFTPPIADPTSKVFFGGPWFGRPQLAAVAWIVGAVFGVGLLEFTFSYGALPETQPVRTARSVASERTGNGDGTPTWLAMVEIPDSPAEMSPGFTTALWIDGDRRGRDVIFDHLDHQRRLGAQLSCRQCHHNNLRFDRGTACAACHSDMYSCTDTFDHEEHVVALRGNLSCARCHPAGTATKKSRSSATDCAECHDFARVAEPVGEPEDLGVELSRECAECHSLGALPAVDRRSPESRGVAPGYQWAMHHLCIGCHRRHEISTGVGEPYLSLCTTCHRSPPEKDGDRLVSSGPVVVAQMPKEGL